tara:strand:+ start:119 stop:556 length:438 start_codon:yes stop_codon:yes gene_type:complete
VVANILVITHFEKTGVRISHNNRYLDVIVDKIDKSIKKVFFKVRTESNYERSIGLRILNQDNSDCILMRQNRERKGFFGIQKKQGQNRKEEIKIGWGFPRDYYIQKGYFENKEFTPEYGDFLERRLELDAMPRDNTKSLKTLVHT